MNHGTGSGGLLVGDEKAVVAGLLLHQIQGVAGESLQERGLHQFHGLPGEHTPETGGPSWLSLDAPPQEPHGRGIFRTEKFDSTGTDDSDIGLQHA